VRAGLEALPAIIRGRGERASRRFIEFFTASIRNRNTRGAYARAAKQFLDWCEGRRLELHDIDALTVPAYVEQLGSRTAKPTVKQHLATIRQLFAYLTSGGILEANPAASVRGPKYVVKRGKTPVLSAAEARQLLDSIESNTLIGLRDRALFGLMVYSFARVGAAVTMKELISFSIASSCGCGYTRRAASVTRFPAIPNWKRTSQLGPRRPGSAARRKSSYFAVSVRERG
jgi:integrase/recombinase XerD